MSTATTDPALDSTDPAPAVDPPAADPAVDPAPAAGTEKLLTQAEFDAALNKRIGRERTKFEADLKTLKERGDLDEVERLKAELEDKDKALSAKDQAVLTTKVETRAERAALAAGVKPERIDRFMKLLDLDIEELAPEGKLDADAIKAAVEATLGDVPEFKGAAGSTAATSGADFAGAGGAVKVWTAEEVDGLSVDEFKKHEPEIMAQMRAGKLQ